MDLFPLQVGSFFGKLFQLRSIKRHFGIVSSWVNLDFIDYHNSPYTKGIAFYFITSHLMDLTWMIPSWLHWGVAKPSRLHWVDVHVKRRFAQSVGCPSSVVPQRFCPENNRLKFDTGLCDLSRVGKKNNHVLNTMKQWWHCMEHAPLRVANKGHTFGTILTIELGFIKSDAAGVKAVVRNYAKTAQQKCKASFSPVPDLSHNRFSPLQVIHTGLRWFRSPQVKQYRSIP